MTMPRGHTQVVHEKLAIRHVKEIVLFECTNTANTPQTHRKHTTNTPQTHRKHTTTHRKATQQIHHKHTANTANTLQIHSKYTANTQQTATDDLLRTKKPAAFNIYLRLLT
jgi:hypothetical protein